MQAIAGARSVRSAFLGANVQSGQRSLLGPSLAPCRPNHQTSTLVVAAYGDLPKVSPGRKWLHRELTKNGKPVRIKVHVKKGDTVQVITGADKDKIGEVLSVDTKTGKIIVKDVNIRTKHEKPKAENQAGQIKKYEAPVQHSNVQLYSVAQGVRSRVGHKMNEAGKKVRYLIKTGEILN